MKLIFASQVFLLPCLFMFSLGANSTNIFGSSIDPKVYLYTSQFSFFGPEFTVLGDESDVESVLNRVSSRNSAAHGDEYFSYTFLDAFYNVAYDAVLLPLRQPRASNPLALMNYVFFTVILSSVLIYWLRVFHLSIMAIATYLVVVSWRFSSSGLSADLKAAAFLSMLCSLLSLMHFCYGQIKGFRTYNPLALLIIQYLFSVSFNAAFLCNESYYNDNSLWVIILVALTIMFITIGTSSDKDSSRGASFFFLISLIAQAYYFYVLMLRTNIYAPPIFTEYYNAFESIILSHGSIFAKAQDFNILCSSLLLRAANHFNGNVNQHFDVTGSFLVIAMITLFASIAATFPVFINYCHYSLRVSKTDADRYLSPPVQYVFGICRFLIDVSTNLIGISGNSLLSELARFNAGNSTFAGASYLASSLCVDAFAVFNPAYVIATSLVLGIFSQIVIIVLTNDGLRELFTLRSYDDVQNLSIEQKLSLLASGRAYIPHAYSPFVGLNVAALAATTVRSMSFISDTGSKSNIIPVDSNRFFICLHQLINNFSENNMASYNVKDILNKIVTIGNEKVKIISLQVPLQKSSIPDRALVITVDKPVASNYLKSEHVQTFQPGLDCVLHSRSRVDSREGRILGCTSKDVFMHSIPTDPGDSGGLIVALNGRSCGMHSGSIDASKSSYAYRLDTIYPQIADPSARIADPKSNATIVSLADSRDLR